MLWRIWLQQAAFWTLHLLQLQAQEVVLLSWMLGAQLQLLLINLSAQVSAAGTGLELQRRPCRCNLVHLHQVLNFALTVSTTFSSGSPTFDFFFHIKHKFLPVWHSYFIINIHSIASVWNIYLFYSILIRYHQHLARMLKPISLLLIKTSLLVIRSGMHANTGATHHLTNNPSNLNVRG